MLPMIFFSPNDRLFLLFKSKFVRVRVSLTLLNRGKKYIFCTCQDIVAQIKTNKHLLDFSFNNSKQKANSVKSPSRNAN